MLSSEQQEPSTSPTTARYIQLVALFFGALSLYQFYQAAKVLAYVHTKDLSYWDSSTVLMLVQLFWVPVAGILLWRRQQAGWMLAVGFCAYLATGAVIFSLWTLVVVPIRYAAIEQVFPALSLLSQLVPLALYGGMGWALNRLAVRTAFAIDPRTQRWVLAAGAGLGLTLYLRLLL